MRFPSRVLKVGAAILGVALTMALVVVGMLPLSAKAAINDKIVVEATSLTSTSASGEPNGQDLVVRKFAKLDFTWDASQAEPKAGDQFEIKLPPEFEILDTTSVPLKGADGVTYGDCAVEAKKVTCTFNDQIAGKTDIKGSGSAIMQAKSTTADSSSEFVLNGKAVAVPLPNNKAIENEAGSYDKDYFEKWAPTLKLQDNKMEWNVLFNSSRLAEGLGQDVSEVEITATDTLKPGHTFEEVKENVKLILFNSQDDPNPREDVVATAGEAAQEGKPQLDVSFEGGKAVFTVKGPLAPETNYRIQYFTIPDGGAVKAGQEYENEVVFNGREKPETAKAVYISSFQITIDLKDGFGTFQVTKRLTGAGASQVPSDTEFTVKAAWELPEGKTAADYEGWEAPANPLELKIKPGAPASPEGQGFPVGTKITLSEDTPPGVDGVTWGDPVIDQDEITIENQTVSKVNITNPAEKGEPTPTPTESTTDPTPTETTTDPTPTETTTDPTPTETTTDPTPTETTTAPTPTETTTAPTPTETTTAPTPTETTTAPTPTETTTAPTPTETTTAPTPTGTPTTTPTVTGTPTPGDTPTAGPTPSQPGNPGVTPSNPGSEPTPLPPGKRPGMPKTGW